MSPMMLNKLPENTPLPTILEFFDLLPRFNERNRCLFALRRVLRLKDIVALKLLDVATQQGRIRNFFISPIDGMRFEFDADVKREIKRYLKFWLLESVPAFLSRSGTINTNIPLFDTQKRASGFSPNTLAQHFSHQDKLIHRHFAPTS